MKTFKDNTDRAWKLSINVSTIKRVRSLLNIDLAKLDANVMAKLLGDPVDLVDVIFCVCAKQEGVTDEDFGTAMKGDAIADATTALVEELINFIPNPRQREAMRKAFQKVKEVETMVMDRVDKKLESGELEKEIKSMMDGTPKT